MLISGSSRLQSVSVTTNYIFRYAVSSNLKSITQQRTHGLMRVMKFAITPISALIQGGFKVGDEGPPITQSSE